MSATQARITKCVFCEWSWRRLWCRSCESACLAPMWLGSKPGPSVISALHFRVVGSRPCSEEIFSGLSSFPLFTKIGIAKFQLDGDLSQSSLDVRGLLARQRRGASEDRQRIGSWAMRKFHPWSMALLKMPLIRETSWAHSSTLSERVSNDHRSSETGGNWDSWPKH